MSNRRTVMLRQVPWAAVCLLALALLALATPGWSVPLQPGEVLLNTHEFLYTDPDSKGQVKLIESHFRRGAVDRFDYEVQNLSYDPVPGSTNGLSGFTITFPAPVPELAGIYNPAGWEVSCCAGVFGTPPDGVEWDNEDGPGVMPGEAAEFGFLTANRADIVWPRGFQTIPGGWMHTWQLGAQTFIFNDDRISGPGRLPEPATLLLVAGGLIALGGLGRRKHDRK